MQYLGVFPGNTQQPGESQVLPVDIWHRRGVCSANSVCSTALVQLKVCCSTRKIKMLPALLILKDLCWYCCFSDTSSQDGLWGVETSSAVTLLTALGSYSGVLGHGRAPGERSGSVRPMTALRHLLGALNFKSLEQVPGTCQGNLVWV